MSIGSAYVQAAAVVCALLGLSFSWVRWRHADPGSGWFAAGFFCIFITFAVNAAVATDVGFTHRAASVTNLLGEVSLCNGLIDFVGLQGAAMWRWRFLLPAPMLLGAAWLPFGGLSRTATHLAIAGSSVLMAWLTWHASRHQKQVNLSLVIGALLLHPLMVLVMLLLGIDLYQLTSVVIIPVALFGMTLFAVSLTRARVLLEQALQARAAAQRQLEEANESLERRVDQRTGELREVIAGLETFNQSVSHDLRGPLGGVAGLSRVAIKALESDQPARATKMLGSIAKQADLLGNLVDDLLLLARVKDAPMATATLSLRTSVDEAVDQLRLAGHDVGPVVIEPLPVVVQGDATLLRQVFVNLIGNALKFSRAAEDPRVRVELMPDPDRILVRVLDNGAGFDAARAGELFEPFKRLHGASFGGTGIGLTIVRRIVDRHGGQVWAEGSSGHGASFYVALPSGGRAVDPKPGWDARADTNR